MESNLYARKLSEKLKDKEKDDLYPPRFRAIINKQPTATVDLNFMLIISNTAREVSFHVVTFSG